MLDVTLAHPNGRRFKAEFDAAAGIVYSRSLLAIDMLTIAAFIHEDDTDLQKLLATAMAVIVLPRRKGALHPEDETMQALERQYADQDIEYTVSAFRENGAGMDFESPWQRNVRSKPEDSDLHSDAGFIRFTRGGPSTILVPERDPQRVKFLHALDMSETKAIKQGRSRGEKLFVAESHLAQTDDYWCQAKSDCVTAWRGTSAGTACLHARPMVNEERHILIGTLNSNLKRQAAFLNRIPLVEYAETLARPKIKPLALARERRCVSTLKAA